MGGKFAFFEHKAWLERQLDSDCFSSPLGLELRWCSDRQQGSDNSVNLIDLTDGAIVLLRTLVHQVLESHTEKQ